MNQLTKPYKYASKVPYTLFFNSLNLEHVINDEIVYDKKGLVAMRFIEKLGSDYSKFKHFMEDKSIGDDYEDSWLKISENKDWFIAYSNIIYMLNEIEEKIT